MNDKSVSSSNTALFRSVNFKRHEQISREKIARREFVKRRLRGLDLDDNGSLANATGHTHESVDRTASSVERDSKNEFEEMLELLQQP